MTRRFTPPIRINWLIALCLCLILWTGCASDDGEVDPSLVGEWTDDNSIYTLREDETFSIKYLRVGLGTNDSITAGLKADSLFGEYNVDQNRQHIHFTMKGYHDFRGDSIVMEERFFQVWKYELDGDELVYQSTTSQGSLNRR